ncbi:MAG: SpoIVB peptidase [Niameybacter sp.]|uniref:SpoIVB peptidase n=1 Tax=Niameybacter sp. TaxID=2033640 RepID=UPI002FCB6739
MRQKKQYKKLLCGLSLLICLLIGSPFIFSYVFPNHIQLAQGSSYEKVVDWPLCAKKAMDDNLQISLLGYIPLKTVNVDVVKPKAVVPCGQLIGVKVESEGICVLGTSPFTSEEIEVSPCKNKLFKGDMILKVEKVEIESKEHLKELVEASNGEALMVEVKRKDEILEVSIRPAYCESESVYKLGLWVKDSAQGIGTLTYYDPESKVFGALGHGINDTDLKKLLPVKTGEVTKTAITAIHKGEKGEPGELKGIIEYTPKNILGSIANNTALGIFGSLNRRGENLFKNSAMPIAYQNEIVEGEACILSNILGNEVRSYEVMIKKVSRYTTEPAKGMVIQITDPTLLEMTNGIIQGMSGSPILQNGKIVGAVTHVFIQDPTKGYGIFIENMINNEIK